MNEFIISKEIINKKYETNYFCICEQNLEIIQTIEEIIINEKYCICLISGSPGIGKKHTLIWTINKNNLNYLFIDSSLFIKKFYECKKTNKSTDLILNSIISNDLIIFDDIFKLLNNSKTNNFLSELCRKIKQLNKKLFFIYNDNITDEKISRINNHISKFIKHKEHSEEDVKKIINYYLKKHNANIKFSKDSIDLLIELLGNNIQIIINNIVELLTLLGNKEHLTIIDKKEVEESFYNKQTKNKNLELINNQHIKVMCKKIDCDYLKIMSPTRKKDIVLNRNIIIYLLRKKFNLSYTKIGLLFNKNHSTIIYSIKFIEEKLKDKDFKKYIETFL